MGRRDPSGRGARETVLCGHLSVSFALLGAACRSPCRRRIGPRRCARSAPVFAFDGTTQPEHGVADAERRLARRRASRRQRGQGQELDRAAIRRRRGHPVAQWKLGRMYADGDGVAQDDLRAFEYFSQIANAHAGRHPGHAAGAHRRQRLRGARALLPQRHSEFEIKSDPERAREMFSYAASYFGNADAQYRSRPALSRRLAERFALWRALARARGQQGPCRARPCSADAVQRRPVAAAGRPRPDVADAGRDSAGADETWIKQLYDNAFAAPRRRPRDGAADARSTGCRGPPRTNRARMQVRACGYAVSRSRSTQTGTWSDGFSQART